MRGESLTITRHGRPVARLVPVDDDRDRALQASRRILERRRRLARTSLSELIDTVHEDIDFDGARPRQLHRPVLVSGGRGRRLGEPGHEADDRPRRRRVGGSGGTNCATRWWSTNGAAVSTRKGFGRHSPILKRCASRSIPIMTITSCSISRAAARSVGVRCRLSRSCHAPWTAARVPRPAPPPSRRRQPDRSDRTGRSLIVIVQVNFGSNVHGECAEPAGGGRQPPTEGPNNRSATSVTSSSFSNRHHRVLLALAQAMVLSRIRSAPFSARAGTASGMDGRQAGDGRRTPVSIERKNEHDHSTLLRGHT